MRSYIGTDIWGEKTAIILCRTDRQMHLRVVRWRPTQEDRIGVSCASYHTLTIGKYVINTKQFKGWGLCDKEIDFTDIVGERSINYVKIPNITPEELTKLFEGEIDCKRTSENNLAAFDRESEVVNQLVSHETAPDRSHDHVRHNSFHDYAPR